jgi:hydroxymethylbilane synthase
VSAAREKRTIRIGTRGSRLALWQATAVANLLEAAGHSCEIVAIKTTGDRSQVAPVAGDDSKRQFVKEIEDALVSGHVDVAVHSAKDMTVELPAGVTIAACLEREDPRDCIVLPGSRGPIEWADVVARLDRSEPPPVIGTGSVRRSTQIAPILRRATFAPIRGNVDTRLDKLDSGGFDALVLACAGLRRLGFEERIAAAIPLDVCVPAPGQGIVAVEARADDEDVRTKLASIHDARAASALAAERAVVAALDGGCKLPLGAIAVQTGDMLEMHGVVASLDGRRTIRHVARGAADRPRELGAQLAEALARDGAREILGHQSRAHERRDREAP